MHEFYSITGCLEYQFMETGIILNHMNQLFSRFKAWLGTKKTYLKKHSVKCAAECATQFMVILIAILLSLF